MIHGNTVDRQQHTRVQALHVSGRAANVDLSVHELNAGHMIDRLIHGVHRAAIEIGFADLRDAGGGALAKMRQLFDDRRYWRQGERGERETDVESHRLRRGDRNGGVEAGVTHRIDTDVERSGRRCCEAIAAARVRAREERRPADTNLRVADGRALVIAHGAVQRSSRQRLRRDCCRRQRECGQ